MPLNAWIGAIVGAVVGAIVWAAITYFTGYEIGYVAWGVGALVGWSAAKFGSRGTQAGVICGVLALASIFVGKVLATNFLVERELEESARAYYTRSLHLEIVEDAKVFSTLASEAEWPQFMIDRRYTHAASADRLRDEELAHFRAHSVPELRNFAGDNAPAYETWASESNQRRYVAEARAELSMVELVKANLSLIDILFALFGIGTAFKLGEGLGAASPAPTRRAGEPPEGPGGLPDESDPPHPEGLGEAPVRRPRRP